MNGETLKKIEELDGKILKRINRNAVRSSSWPHLVVSYRWDPMVYRLKWKRSMLLRRLYE